MSIKCKIKIHSNSLHLQQVYLGLSLLASEKKIVLTYDFADSCKNVKVPSSVHTSSIELEVNGKTIIFDMADAPIINEKSLANCELYFKRSFAQSHVLEHNFSHKIKPYGLNYLVYPDNFDWFSLRRAFAFYRSTEWLKQITRNLDINNSIQYSPRISDLQAKPDLNIDPKVLFLARTWDSNSDDYYTLSTAEQSDRFRINEIRAECIRQLRKEFGDRFTGGLAPTPHSKKYFPDCIVDIYGMTSKKNYLQLVKNHNICIATTGLHGSIGWKFAEYVALSRAIVSEKLNYDVPGQLENNKNYLEFTTVDQCVSEVGNLMDTPRIREKLSKENFKYYQNYLKPSKIIWNCLKQAL